MKVTILHTEGALDIASVPNEDVMEMIEEFRRPEAEIMQFVLDDESVAYLNRRHIIRIDVDPEPNG
jgi:hypothetical protein